MAIKIIHATAFSTSIEVDDRGYIIRTPKQLQNFLNQPLSMLTEILKRNTLLQQVSIEDVQEAE